MSGEGKVITKPGGHQLDHVGLAVNDLETLPFFMCFESSSVVLTTVRKGDRKTCLRPYIYIYKCRCILMSDPPHLQRQV